MTAVPTRTRRAGLALAALGAAASLLTAAALPPAEAAVAVPPESLTPVTAASLGRTAGTTLSATTTSSTNPSGVSVPPTSLPGWKRVFADNFTGTSLSSAWGKYKGQPGGNPVGWWEPSHVTVGNGALVLRGYRSGGKFVTGGVAAWGATMRTYGKYLIRFRADKGSGVGYAFLLWPKNGWPPEIDFAEDGGGSRSGTSATLHYTSENKQIQRFVKADFSRWQTVGVEWTPGLVRYTLNGKVWGTVKGSMVPKQPMFLAMQSAALPCTQWNTCLNASTPSKVNVYIDWVAVYRPA